MAFCTSEDKIVSEQRTEPKPPKHAEQDWRHPPCSICGDGPCGICGGEPKKLDPQRIRRVVDGVIIVEYVR